MYYYGGYDKNMLPWWNDNWDKEGPRADFNEWVIEDIENNDRIKERLPIDKFAFFHWEQLVSRIIRLEDIQTEFSNICSNIGIPPTTKIPHLNVSRETKDSKITFNKRSIDIVENIFAKDIEIGKHIFNM